MAGSMGGRVPPEGFTPFYEPPRVKIARWWGKTKRVIGTSSTVGVVAVLAPIPGPHTVVLLVGMAVGAALAIFTGKKNNSVKVSKK